ncbi:unnamed protein product [Bursaphelenchus okinawaensis]|uniref:Uncharacterized protein n=1 Tax=Bursaphelenchus okinawaensis TaxID=465554 RepID=A0A811KBW0_9BILA|nr:unnamed protein product [Bursaphelenchus okinawaensis]CAG9101213.1 unnamed protein product [Bursaphelenchus okinawaensis]
MRTYLGVLLLLFNNVYCDLIPYGEGYGDSFIPFADDPVAMVLRAPFALFNERYDEFYISPHGAVSFETPLNGFDDLENKNVIAPYYLEATAGNIYWRMDYANSELDRNITRKMRKGFDLRDFRATEFILVTWEDIAGAGSNGLNTFQLGLATDGSQSYAIFTYSKLDYAYSGGKFAQIGFWGRGQDTVYGFNSGTEAARTLNGLGFLGEKGLYVYYTVGKPELGQKEEEEYDYKEMEKEYDELSDEEEDVEQPKDCPPDPYGENCPAHCSRPVDSRGCRLCVCADPSGPRYSPNGYQPAVTNQNTPSGGALTCSPTPAAEHEQCHNDARCESYGPGYCCKCAEGFLGNGKQCFAKSTAVRVNGNLEGAVNGNEIEKTEFYVYITPDAGQQHTTIPRVSSTLGYSMQFLDGIANINDWLFAKVESHNALNGIQLTGGKLNVTSTVLIGDKTQLFIKQFYRPKPQSSDLEVDVTVSGTIPDLPYGATIEFTDFDAKYTKSEAGRLRSYADRHVAVTADSVESQYRVTVDTQIKYDECSFATSSAVFMVHTDRISGVFEAKDETLRFGSQSVVYNEEDSANANSKRRNPCSGNHLCTEPHMECVSEEGNFRCQCQSGYQHEHDSSVQVQFRCVDRNECLQPGICDRNANCENSEGSYTCTCRQGFIGNGRSCRPEGEAGPEAPAGSTACTEHSQCHQWGECVFGQNGQPAYCKCRGWYVGDGVNHCGPPEPQNNENDVDRCGGHVCHEHAECRQNEQGQDICVCRNGYHGNGVHCIPLQHEEQHRHVDSTAAVCRNDAECSENAQCVYNAHSRYYRCECRPPFSGDGTTCVLDQNRPAPQTCESSLGCHRHAICVATGQREPAARCQCTQGFEGNGTWCVDYDEYRRLYGQGRLKLLTY